MARKRFTTLPTDSQIASIPLAAMAEFELSEKEVLALRRHIYAINRAGFRRYRTLREDGLVLVWRIK